MEEGIHFDRWLAQPPSLQPHGSGTESLPKKQHLFLPIGSPNPDHEQPPSACPIKMEMIHRARGGCQADLFRKMVFLRIAVRSKSSLLEISAYQSHIHLLKKKQISLGGVELSGLPAPLPQSRRGQQELSKSQPLTITTTAATKVPLIIQTARPVLTED